MSEEISPTRSASSCRSALHGCFAAASYSDSELCRAIEGIGASNGPMSAVSVSVKRVPRVRQMQAIGNACFPLWLT